MSRVYIAAGSNLGNRLQHLETAFDFLCRVPSLKFVQLASVYETLPVGGPLQGDFLNTLWVFETSLPPQEVLRILHAAEQVQGRVRGEKNGPRQIDLDLAACDEMVLELDNLSIPHERMHERWFVLKPLCDVAPQWIHPRFKKTAFELLTALDSSQTGTLYKKAEPEKEMA